MPHRWLAYIDNIASFRDGMLLFDIERHTAQRVSTRGKIAHAPPHYAFMIDHAGAVEKSRLFKKPLTAKTFRSVLDRFDDYHLDRQTSASIRYLNPAKNVFCAWDDCVSFGQARAGSMVGLIQLRPVESLPELLKKTLPAALEDWNRLALMLGLRRIDNRLFSRLSRQAIAKNKAYPRPKKTLPWPKRPIRFLFEQE